jgi:hypothetical protein
MRRGGGWRRFCPWPKKASEAHIPGGPVPGGGRRPEYLALAVSPAELHYRGTVKTTGSLGSSAPPGLCCKEIHYTRRFATGSSALSGLCCKEKVIRHRHTATGSSAPPGLCCKEIDYTRRFAMGASPPALRGAGTGLSAPIPRPPRLRRGRSAVFPIHSLPRVNPLRGLTAPKWPPCHFGLTFLLRKNVGIRPRRPPCRRGLARIWSQHVTISRRTGKPVISMLSGYYGSTTRRNHRSSPKTGRPLWRWG